MISIIIPCSEYAFFPQANYKNILETCGRNDLEFYFLTTSKELETPGEKIVFDKKPFHGIHLEMLDWAFRNLNLKEYVYIQHEDTIWGLNGKKNWLCQNFENNIYSFPYENYLGDFKHLKIKYKINDQPIIRSHDFIGIYNRNYILDNNLTFKMGKCKDVLSEYSLNNLNKIKLNNKTLTKNSFLDGSDAISIECYLRNNAIKELEINDFYYHSWDLFAFIYDAIFLDEEIIINRPIKRCLRGLKNFSWLSTFLFEEGNFIPWSLYLKLASKLNLEKTPSNLCLLFYKYKTKKIDERKSKIKKLTFTDISIEDS